MKKMSTSFLIASLTIGLMFFIMIMVNDPHPDLQFTYYEFENNSKIYMVKGNPSSEAEYIYVPAFYNGVKVEIDAFAFENMPVKTLELGEGFIDLYHFSLSGSTISKITLPSTLEYLGGLNQTIETVIFSPNSNLKQISEGFRETMIRSIVIPKSVEKITGSIFKNTINLEEVIFEEGSKLIEIGFDGAFYNTKLQSITLPKSVKKIRSGTFAESTVKLYFEEGSLLEEIGVGAFSNSSSLNYIPEGVKIIGSGAFSGASLNHVTIPPSVIHIGRQAFSRIPTLESIHMSSNIPFVAEYIFDKTENVTIYISGQDLIGYDPKWNDNYDGSVSNRQVVYLEY